MSSRAKKSLKLTKQGSPGMPNENPATPPVNEDYDMAEPGRQQRYDGDGLESCSEPNQQLTPSFPTLDIATFLSADPRPAVVFDLSVDFGLNSEPVYANAAFRAIDSLVAELKKDPELLLSPEGIRFDFRSWIKRTETPSSFQYHGLLWTAFVFQQRWKVISGSPSISTELGATKKALSTPDTERNLTLNLSDVVSSRPGLSRAASYADTDTTGISSPSISSSVSSSLATPDWTVDNPKGELSLHVQFARTIDWGKTSLGPMQSWSKEFRQLANKLMADPHPAAMFYGEELTVIYNEPYAFGVAGRKHPRLMGTNFKGEFKELWDGVAEIFLECRKTGIGRAQVDQMLPIERYGFLEETFFCWSLVPLYAGEPTLQGLWNQPFETTRSTLNNRRMSTLMTLSEEISLAKTVSSFWQLILKPLEENEFDVPFALLYSVVDDVDVDEGSSISSESSHTMKSCILEGALGVPEGHDAAPTKLDLKRARGGFIPAFRDAMRTREPSLLNIMDGTLKQSLIEGFNWRGFGEPCKQAVVCPIRPTTGENVLGFLVLGINPRRPYDRDYQTFIRLLIRQLATSLASVTLFEEEIRRGTTAAEAAALERLKLSEELAVQRSRLQRMAEVSPVGMFSIDPQGLLLEANDRWFHMTAHPMNTTYAKSWMDVVMDESRPDVEYGWQRLTVQKLPWECELKLKKPWHDPTTGALVDHWVLLAAQPEFTSEGDLKTVMGSITDITLQKRSAEDALTRAKLSEELLLRTQEAKESEENFKRFADICPGGLFVMDAEQRITYANTRWHTITGSELAVASGATLSWSEVLHEDDLPLFNSKWDEMITKHKMVTAEVRMRTPVEVDLGSSSQVIERWILASVVPEIGADDSLMSLMGCADGISTSLTEYQTSKSNLDESLIELFKDSIEAAETIQLCAQHQKSIVDDILTISKLDSDLLLITPVSVQPISVVRQSLKMFVAECQMNHISLNFHIDESFNKLKVDRVMLDSSRLLQVLINLLTNAIKFTKSEAHRSISVSISAHLQPPEERNSKFKYFPTKKARLDVTASSDWGTGEILFLRFEVQDTGCGLTPDEEKLLFTRFSQASPRTHVRYGGSGLGLFISRQLTELQGGEIGVASEAGVGSTFAFYVKSRRATLDKDPSEMEYRLRIDLQDNARPSTTDVVSVKRQSLKYVEPEEQPKSGAMPLNPNSLYVLIVEDNLVNQKILAAQIRKLGCTVYVANHGGEALDLLQETRFYKGKELNGKELSVILMDLEMPIMDGLTCVRKIREMEVRGEIVGHVPVIAVTANARGEQIATAKDSGMDDVIPKPFRIRQLMPKIEVLLEKTRAMAG
ncbi:hypothetical protein BP5796_05194 [Coleophoma crateriformis]|uniref:Uncharacterized protein n=1 Tax=Coleophoma crateriformis TaxID=565419 RepID=A0A3D8S2K8_9HELO|nr:hypothetical protein BP5796_05194 [Coleophoma crateriformis]